MMIQAMITRIDQQRIGTDQKLYHVVLFRTEDGRNFRSYISPDMRNFSRWKKLLIVGNVVGNLTLMCDEKTIDADSRPVRVPTLRQPSLFA